MLDWVGVRKGTARDCILPQQGLVHLDVRVPMKGCGHLDVGRGPERFAGGVIVRGKWFRAQTEPQFLIV